jgi:hypothetical protein
MFICYDVFYILFSCYNFGSMECMTVCLYVQCIFINHKYKIDIIYMIILLIPQHVSVIYHHLQGGRRYFHLKNSKRHTVHKMVTINSMIVTIRQSRRI